MKNIYLTILLLCLIAVTGNAQMHYSLTGGTNTFTPISGTVPFLMAGGSGSDPLADEGYVNNIPIGFSFNYNGAASYTEVSISTNGFISFQELSDSYVLNNLTSGAAGERPIVAPLWDDINLQSTANLTYTTTGSSPNRVFTVQWLNARWGFGASAAAMSFQVKLYETSNWIEFIYRQESGSANSPSASIGLAATSTGSYNFISLMNVAASPAATMTSEVATLANKPANNQSYLFKAGVLPVSIASVSVSKNNSNNIVSWQTANETNNAGFDVERSADGRNFSRILFVDTKATNGNSNGTLSYTASDSKPLDGTNYYRLKQVDKNGSINYSSIVSIKNSSTDAWGSLLLYPNPVKDKLVVQLNSKQTNGVTVAIYNAVGNRVMLNSYAATAGATQIGADVSMLPAGTYTVRVTNNKNDQPLIKTFVK